MNALVQARHLSRQYAVKTGPFRPDATVKALADASFDLSAGKTLAVVGESGCGKSTLARLVTMIEPPSGGDLQISGIDVSNASEAEQRALRSSVQIVFQDPYGSLNPRHKIGSILEEPVRINRPEVNATDREAKARAMLERVGLRPEHYERYPHMFSGGQRQRIAIARALMLEPRVLVLDEPVSALDLSIQSQILNLLVELQQTLGLAYLFISHDLSVVRHVADEVMVMYLGRVVEHGTREQVFEASRHPYTRALLSATPIADPEHRRERIRLAGELPSPIDPPAGCAFHPRCWRADATCKANLPPLAAGGGGEGDAGGGTGASTGIGRIHSVACFHPLKPGEPVS